MPDIEIGELFLSRWPDDDLHSAFLYDEQGTSPKRTQNAILE
jgi:hypothetical protein